MVRVRLEEVRIRNFKSFYDEIVIENFLNFVCIIGDNGVGKSNLIDAIAFALNIRASRNYILSELVSRSTKNEKSFVSVKFSLELNGEKVEKKFERTIENERSSFRLNGQSTTKSEYEKELNNLGIDTRNLSLTFVFQDRIRNLATLTDGERLNLIEDLCSPKSLRNKYDVLLKEYEKSYEMFRMTMDERQQYLRKFSSMRNNEMKQKQFDSVLVDIGQSKMRERLICLKYLHNQIEGNEKENFKLREKNFEEKRKNLIPFQTRKNEDEMELKNLVCFMKMIDRETIELSKRLAQLRRDENTSKRKRSDFQSNKNSLNKQLKVWRNKLVREMNYLQEMNNKLKFTMEKLELNEKGKIARENEEGMRHANSDDLAQYLHLKGQFNRESEQLRWELDRIDDEIHLNNDEKAKATIIQFENELQRCVMVEEMENKNFREELEREKSAYKIQLEEYHLKMEEKEKELRKMEEELMGKNENLNNVSLKLEKFYVSHSELHRKKVVKILQDNLPSNTIYGRLKDFIRPKSSNLNLAILSVLSSCLNNILISDMSLLKNCSEVMDRHRILPENFLVVNRIPRYDISAELNKFIDEQKLSFIYHHIDIDVTVAGKNPIEIDFLKNVISSLAKDWILCETDEIAQNIAYSYGRRHQTVTLDGTKYGKNGVISGGKESLNKKLYKLDDKYYDNLTNEQERLRREIDELQSKSLNLNQSTADFKLDDIERQISTIENELKIQTDVDHRLEIRTEELKEKLSFLKKDFVNIQRKKEELMKERSATKKLLDEIEWKYFGKFLLQFPQFESYKQFEKNEVYQCEFYEHKLELLRTEIEGIIEIINHQKETTENYTKKNLLEKQKQFDAIEREIEALPSNDLLEEEMKKILEKIDNLENDKKMNCVREKSILEGVGEVSKKIKKIEELMERNEENIRINDKSIEEIQEKRLGIIYECYLEGIDISIRLDDDWVKLRDIEILRDIIQSQSTTQTSSHSLSQIFSQFTQNQTTNREKTERIISAMRRAAIDFKLIESFELGETEEDVQKLIDEERKEQINLNEELNKCRAPNVSIDEHQRIVRETNDIDGRYHRENATMTRKKREYLQLKNERQSNVETCLNTLNEKIDLIYKSLTKCPGSRAMLRASNCEAIFDGVITFQCCPPAKTWTDVSEVSGGEKSFAILSLLFAIYEYKCFPLVLFDEIDDCLDRSNMEKLLEYILDQVAKRNVQYIFISHKSHFYERAQQIIGVYTNKLENMIDFDGRTSRTLLLNLNEII
ncbi:hypothetical protein SNEBB_010794 [Seison nebaliae]|nr:hypothetical protein SNEBB_010794 [Seison nebaliae]